MAYLGSLVKVAPALFATYSRRGRTIDYHRAQIRRAYGTRPPTEDDEDRWAQWLAAELCPAETNRDRLAAALRRRCRSEKVEPPRTGQVERVVASGCRQFDDDFAATAAGRLGPVACGRLEELLSRPGMLAELKSGPGPLGLDTLLAEIGKLSAVRAFGLDEAVFGGASDRIVAAWRARAARMYPSDFTDCPEPVRRREVYVQGAGRWKDPDQDLPGDFEDNRDVHYAELASPWTPPSSPAACGSGWMTGSPGSTPPWPGAPAAGCGSSPGRAARG